MDKVFDKPLKYMIKTHLLYHNSIDDYFGHKEPSMKRWLTYWSKNLLLFILLVRFGLLSLQSNLNEYNIFRDASILLGDQAHIFHLFGFILYLVTLCLKLSIFYYESKYKMNFLVLLSNYQAQTPFYKLNLAHRKSIKNKSNLLYYAYMRGLASLSSILAHCVLFGLSVYAQVNFEVNIIIYWLTFLLFFPAIFDLLSVVLNGPFIFYLPIMIINYKLDELVNILKACILLRNDQAIDKFLSSYHHLTIIIKQISGLYNMIIGIVYCVVSYTIAIMLQISQIERDDLIFKTIKYFAYFGLIVTNINAYLINRISASITVRNKAIPRLLYPIFINNNIIDLRLKLRIDSFIDRLHNQYIGFYCFNLFKFTKMAFYQYIFTVSSCYILVAGFAKNM